MMKSILMNNQSLLADKELESYGYTPKLSRSLGLWSLTSFGLTYLQPIGPAVVFGYLLKTSGGSVALPYTFAFIGMLFTVLSYSVLIKEYPLAGSIYNYVKIIIGPFWGFLAGWLLALDYILIPTITSVSAAIYAHQLIPAISYESWLITFVLGMGILNLVGIRCATFFGGLMLLIQIAIVLLGLYLLAIYIVGTNGSIYGLISLKPFHFASVSGVIQASSLAIFSFLGFDAVTTLAEEAVNPKKDIPRAMLICICIGFGIMFLTGYLGVMAIPNWGSLMAEHGWVDVALFKITKMTSSDLFTLTYSVGFILAMMVSNLVGTAAATRLLYGMGRDGIISKQFFSAVNTRWKTPHMNILIIATVEVILGSFVNQDQLAEMINYGAITGFIILNISLLCFGYKYVINNKELINPSMNEKIRSFLKCFIFPLIATVVMIEIFIHIKPDTIVYGTAWALIGVIYYFFRPSLIY